MYHHFLYDDNNACDVSMSNNHGGYCHLTKMKKAMSDRNRELDFGTEDWENDASP